MPPTGTQPSDRFGAFLQDARERQGLSIRQLARLVDAQPSTVLRWETNVSKPKAGAMNALARALEVPTVELMARAGVDYPHDAPSLPAMLRSEYDLPPEAIDQVQRYVERMARKHNKHSSSSNKRGGTDEHHKDN